MVNQILYGFYNLKDLGGQRVTTLGVDTVNTAIDATLAEHNRQLAALNGLFVENITAFQKRYKQRGAKRLQPLDNAGRARPTKTAGYYDLGFPIISGGDAFGADYVTRVKMTVQELQDELASSLVADKRWNRDHLLGALFASTSYSFVDPLNGTLTVQPLANGDSVNYLIENGTDAGTTDTHQLAQAAAIADGANPFPTIYTELTEHPENAGEVVAFVPTNLIAAVEALSLFIAVGDSAVQVGANTSRLVATLNVPVPGVLRGRVSKVWIVEWAALPDNYIIATTTGGSRPIAMREDEEPELRGFKRVAERNDHPWYESQFLRRAGYGGYNRVGAVVMRIGNASYAVPTNYTVPMP